MLRIEWGWGRGEIRLPGDTPCAVVSSNFFSWEAGVGVAVGRVGIEQSWCRTGSGGNDPIDDGLSYYTYLYTFCLAKYHTGGVLCACTGGDATTPGDLLAETDEKHKQATVACGGSVVASVPFSERARFVPRMRAKDLHSSN